MTPTADAHRANNFDIIRLALAAAVLFSHCPEITDGNRGREQLTALFLAGGCFYLFRGAVPLRTIGAVVAGAVMVAGLAGTSATAQLASCTAGAYLLFWVAFRTRPIRIKHDISYGLYLYGWPVQKLLAWYAPGLSPWLLFAAALPLATACATASWFLVERPFLRFKAKASRP